MFHNTHPVSDDDDAAGPAPREEDEDEDDALPDYSSLPPRGYRDLPPHFGRGVSRASPEYGDLEAPYFDTAAEARDFEGYLAQNPADPTPAGFAAYQKYLRLPAVVNDDDFQARTYEGYQNFLNYLVRFANNPNPETRTYAAYCRSRNTFMAPVVAVVSAEDNRRRARYEAQNAAGKSLINNPDDQRYAAYSAAFSDAYRIVLSHTDAGDIAAEAYEIAYEVRACAQNAAHSHLQENEGLVAIANNKDAANHEDVAHELASQGIRCAIQAGWRVNGVLIAPNIMRKIAENAYARARDGQPIPAPADSHDYRLVANEMYRANIEDHNSTHQIADQTVYEDVYRHLMCLPDSAFTQEAATAAARDIANGAARNYIAAHPEAAAIRQQAQTALEGAAQTAADEDYRSYFLDRYRSQQTAQQAAREAAHAAVIQQVAQDVAENMAEAAANRAVQNYDAAVRATATQAAHDAAVARYLLSRRDARNHEQALYDARQTARFAVNNTYINARVNRVVNGTDIAEQISRTVTGSISQYYQDQQPQITSARGTIKSVSYKTAELIGVMAQAIAQLVLLPFAFVFGPLVGVLAWLIYAGISYYQTGKAKGTAKFGARLSLLAPYFVLEGIKVALWAAQRGGFLTFVKTLFEMLKEFGERHSVEETNWDPAWYTHDPIEISLKVVLGFFQSVFAISIGLGLSFALMGVLVPSAVMIGLLNGLRETWRGTEGPMSVLTFWFRFPFNLIHSTLIAVFTGISLSLQVGSMIFEPKDGSYLQMERAPDRGLKGIYADKEMYMMLSSVGRFRRVTTSIWYLWTAVARRAREIPFSVSDVPPPLLASAPVVENVAQTMKIKRFIGFSCNERDSLPDNAFRGVRSVGARVAGVADGGLFRRQRRHRVPTAPQARPR